MQGLGRAIISFEAHGHRLVAIGNQLRWSKNWRTFHDFLFDYIRAVFTPEWGNTELAKTESNCHQLIRWYRKVCEYQRTSLASLKQGEI
jgi:hypothetical protein